MKTLSLFLRLARPHFLLGGILMYALGVGIAQYLGEPIDWGLYVLGQIWITLMQLSTQFLNEYFNAPMDLDNEHRTLFSGGSGVLGPGGLPRPVALWAAVVCLAIVASLTVPIIQAGALGPALALVMVLIFLGAFFYSVPPLKLESSGYGELTASVLVANLVPAFSLLLITGDLHPFLAIITFPLTALHLAMLLAFELPDYASDVKHGKRTLMVRMGWQAGMNLHNIMIFSAYFLLALALLMNFPFVLGLPAILTLPLGLLQIWQMARIAGGAKPNWTALTFSAVALFALTAYLLAFGLWTR